jgi:hypothetical protein
VVGVLEQWGTGCRPDPFEGWRDGIEYRADEAYLEDGEYLPLHPVPDGLDIDDVPSGWQPAASMPELLIRTHIRILTVEAKMVTEITEEQAKTAGVHVRQRAAEKHSVGGTLCLTCGKRKDQHVGTVDACPGGYGTCFTDLTYRGGFKYMWNSRHPDLPSAGRPWMWMYGTELVKGDRL